MIGRRPEPMPGSEPGRWRVVKSHWLGHRVAPWCVEREGCGGAAFFPTWEEAQEYADRQARTVEVVLPRQQLPLSLPGLEEDDPIFVTYDIEEGCVILTDQGDGDMIVLYPHELRPLALALLALMEKKGDV